MALQIRRGLQASLPASPADGELLYATDTNKLYVGDGGTAQEISGGAGSSTLDGLSDVTLVGTPTNGQVLKYDGAAWSNSGDIGLINLIDDTSPQLGGNLDVTGYKIVTTGNGNIELDPGGTGDIILHGNFNIDTNGNITKSGQLNISPTGITSFGNNLTSVDGNIYITRNTFGNNVWGQGFIYAQSHNVADAANFSFYRTRGTGLVPTAIASGDDIVDINFVGYDGAGQRGGAVLSAIVEGAVSVGVMPTKLQFQTNNGTALAPRAELSSAGVWKVNNIQNYSGTDLNITGSGIVTATNSIIGNGAATPAAGTTLTVNGTVTGGSLTVGSILSGGTTVFGTSITAVNSATFTSTINTTTMTVASVSAGTITVGMSLSGGAVTAGTYVVAFVSGVNGGVGVYTLNQSATGTPTTGRSYTVNTSQLITSTTLTAGGNVNLVGFTNAIGHVKIFAQNSLRLADADSSAYVAFRAPAVVPANLTWILPAVDGTSGQLLSTNGSGTLSWASSGSGLTSRTAVSGTTASIADGVKSDVTVANAYKGYILYKIETNVAAWVRVYVDIPSRTSDATRLEGADPLPGAGVVAEVITTGAQTILLSPGTIGFNNEVSPSTNIYLAVTNKSGSTTSVIVTLTILQIEA